MSRRLAAALAVAEARSRIVEAIRPVNELRIEPGCILGRILAEDIVASRPHPSAAVAAMDGYALRFSDASGLPTQENWYIQSGREIRGEGFGWKLCKNFYRRRAP
jgi:molybdopterin biosynthesis enzyme